MANRIVIDPVTRIEGHLRLEVEVKDGRVVDAYSSGTMVRGTCIPARRPRSCGACGRRPRWA